METMPVVQMDTRSAGEVKAGIDLILQVMKTVMKQGVDFGLVPGCGDKPTLLKPGSEKILATFKIAVDPEVEDLSTEDEARYRVKARLFHGPSGIELGKGLGEASTNEEKYRWRKAICDEEFAETAEDRKRLAWKAEWSNGRKTGKFTQVKQVRTNKADVSNTVLKMAKKRAQIDATLTATAASAIFAQDLEDLQEEIRETIIEEESERRPNIKEPEAKTESQKPADAKTVKGVLVTAVKVLKTGSNTKGEWTMRKVVFSDGIEAITFDDGDAAVADRARTENRAVVREVAKTDKGYDLKSLDFAEVAA
jgi:hypothetical protein